MARVYNHITGANITHRDVADWGYTEETLVMLAINELLEK